MSISIEKNRSQKEGVKRLFFCFSPPVGFSAEMLVGGEVLLAGIWSDLFFCDRGRKASALLVVLTGAESCRRRKVGYQLIVT